MINPVRMSSSASGYLSFLPPLYVKLLGHLRNIKKKKKISYNDEYELIVHTDIFNLRLFMTKLEGGFRNYSTPKVIGKLTEKPFREQVSAIV